MKKKLLVILGSGSSVSVGFPSVGDLDRSMTEWAASWTRARQWPDYFRELWEAIDRYQLPAIHSWFPKVNYERVLGNMLALSHLAAPPPSGDSLKSVIGDALRVSPPSEPGEHAMEIALREQIGHLVRCLASYMRRETRERDWDSQGFASYKALFDKLRDAFDIGVFSLNYDGAAVRALPGAFVGFDRDGVFDGVGVHRCSSDFLYHLHGSVHFSLRQTNQAEIRWRDDLAGDFIDDDGGVAPMMASDRKLLPVATLVAGGLKLDQLLAEPFQSFQARLVRHFYEADVILIGGYGFADMHVNRALTNRLARGGRPPVMILDHRPPGALSIPNEPWKTGVCHTLLTDGYFFKAGVDDRLEVNTTHRIALWRGGFHTAAASLELMNWLNAAETVL